MSRTSSPPTIDKQTQGQLLAYVGSHTSEQRMALRAGIVLDWLDGATYDESTQKRNVSRHTIAKWRKRFKAKGVEGLRDKQRSGKPPTITIAQRKKVVHLACSKPPGGRQRRSQTEIAQQMDLSQSMVSQILRAEQLQPHKTACWRAEEPGSAV